MMPLKYFRITAVSAMLAWSGLIQAMPILQGTSTAATGFLNLEIGGEHYNARFHSAKYFYELYPPPSDDGIHDAIWWDEPAIAQSVGDAIVAALVDNHVTGIEGFASFLPDSVGAAFGLPTGARPAGFGNFIIEGYLGLLGPDSGDTWTSSNTDVSTFGGPGFYANVSLEPAKVAIPSPIWLLTPALLGLVFSKRHRSCPE